MSKSARAKERRRRGKDPLKELMKPGGGKLAKVLKAAEVSTSSGTTVTPSTPSHSRTSSAAYQRRASISRQPEKSPSEDSSKSQQAGSSSSSTVALPASTPQEVLLAPSFDSPSFSASRSRSKSRSRSRPRNDNGHVDHEPSTSKSRLTSNSDVPSTISSASSSTATEATTSSTSTAPSSITSSASGGSDANATPKAESGRGSSMSSSTLPTPPSPSKKRQNQDTDPWEWDGVGSASASVTPAGPKPSSLQLPKPRATNTASSSGTEGTPVPYASVVTAKSSNKEDSRSTVGAHTEAKEDYHSSSSFGRDAETVEEEEEVAPLVFPSLNNPAPDSSSSASSFSVGPTSTPSSSLSRPPSRTSTSSGTPSSPHITGKVLGRNLNSSNLVPFSVARTGTPPLGGGPRRIPTPLGTSGMRPATPAGASAASSPLLSGNSVPLSPSSQSFPHSSSSSFGAGSSVAVSAQTQVASLRGALEASRLREQKQKDEVERVTKERDMLQWENGAWRRREAELQVQVQQMMHQMQTYAAYFQAVNQGQHPPPVGPLPLPTASTSSQTTAPTVATESVGTGEETSERDRRDDTTQTDAGNILSSASQTDRDNDTTPGGNSDEKAQEALVGGAGEGSAASYAESSVPDQVTSASSLVKEKVDAPSEQEAEQVDQISTAGAEGAKGVLAPVATAPATHPSHPLPPPIAPPAYNPALAHGTASGMLSPTMLHSPMGMFPHYPLHATPPAGFGPHGHPMPLPSPMAFPFHPSSPLPMLSPHQSLHHPFATPFGNPPGSAPQSPGAVLMPHQSFQQQQQHPSGLNMNPFIVHPPAFHRPSTPGGGIGSMIMNGTHHAPAPHMHNPVGMGMGMGLAGSSTFTVAGGVAGGSGSASPDLTGSPSSATAFLMQERGRRRMSGGSGSGLRSSVRGRPSVLPLESGISRRTGVNGKTSSGSSSNGDVEGEEERGGVESPGDFDEEEEDGGFNEVLAGAILKRPESIRLVSGPSRKSSFRRDSGEPSPLAASGLGLSGGGSVSLNAIWNGFGHGGSAVGASSPQERTDVQEEEVVHGDFVFPSLNDAGPVVREKAVNGIAYGSPAAITSSPPSGAVSAPVAVLSRPSSSLGKVPEEEGPEATLVKSDSAPP